VAQGGGPAPGLSISCTGEADFVVEAEGRDTIWAAEAKISL